MMQLALALFFAVFALGACKAVDRVGKMPPAATRTTPPPNIAQAALAVGQSAPVLELPTHDGERYVLAKRLQDGPAVLVFYRGDW